MASKLLPLTIVLSLVGVGGLVIYNSSPKYHEEEVIAFNTLPNDSFTSHWIKYISKKGNFEVMFPSGTQYLEDYALDEETKKENHYQMFLSEENDGSVFMISIASYKNNKSSNDPKVILDKAIQTMFAKHSNQEKIESLDTTFDDFPAKSIHITQKEYTILARAFLAGDDVYLLSYLTKTANVNQSKFEYFLSSFSFLPST